MNTAEPSWTLRIQENIFGEEPQTNVKCRSFCDIFVSNVGQMWFKIPYAKGTLCQFEPNLIRTSLSYQLFRNFKLSSFYTFKFMNLSNIQLVFTDWKLIQRNPLCFGLFGKNCISSIYRKFGWKITYTNRLRSVHNNHNIAWDNKTHSLIGKTSFPILSNNVLHTQNG